MNPKLLVGAALIGALSVLQPFRLYVVSGDSMSPTLYNGQLLVGDAHPKRVARGDVVVFHHDGEAVVKRVAYLPGDRIEEFLVFGEWRMEISERARAVMIRRRLPRKEYVVPAKSLYVLGDNSFGSVDSRFYGAVPMDDLLAVVPWHGNANAPTLSAKTSRMLVARL